MLDFKGSEVSLTGSLTKRLRTMRPFLQEAGAYMQRKVQTNILQQRDFQGRQLKPLAPRTVEEKRRRRKSPDILRRDGGLLASMSYRLSGPNAVEVGTNLGYAPAVILGTGPYTINIRGGQRTLRFKVDRKTGRSRFATRKRANFEQTVKTRDRTIQHPGLPRRQVLGISGADRRVLAEMLQRYLDGGGK